MERLLRLHVIPFLFRLCQSEEEAMHVLAEALWVACNNYQAMQQAHQHCLETTASPDMERLVFEREQRFADPHVPHQEQFGLAADDSLALVSDGITQFITAENTPVLWETLIPKFVDFKRPAGVFVRRRMNFFERENRAAGIRHLDDLSVAAITLLR